MKYYKYEVATVSITFLLASALFSFASLAQAEVSVSGVGEVKAGDTETPSVKAGYSVTAKSDENIIKGDNSVKMEDGMQAGTRMTEEKSEGTSTQEQERGIENAKMHADEHAMPGLETAVLHIDVASLMKDENAPAHGASDESIDTAAKVHSSVDFEHFVSHKAKTDSALKDVEVKDGKVSVTYNEPAELFGFINTTLSTHVSVDAQGKVQVAYPWYHIFMKEHASRASIQSDIARALAAENKAGRENVATSSASVTTQATIAAGLGIPNIFEIIANSLKDARVTGEAAMK